MTTYNFHNSYEFSNSFALIYYTVLQPFHKSQQFCIN